MLFRTDAEVDGSKEVRDLPLSSNTKDTQERMLNSADYCGRSNNNSSDFTADAYDVNETFEWNVLNRHHATR